MSVGAVIFDVDGVLVKSPHERAWRDALALLMATEWATLAPAATYAPERFTTAVYQEHVAGKARLDGATAVLEFFGMPLAAQLAVTYAERKQRMIDEFILRGEFEAFPDGLRLVVALRSRGTGWRSRRRRGTRIDSWNASSSPATRRCGTSSTSTSAAATSSGASRIRTSSCWRRASWESRQHAASWSKTRPPRIRQPRRPAMLGLGVARLDDSVLLEVADADLVVSNLDRVSLAAIVDGRLEREREPFAIPLGGGQRQS